MEQAGVDEVTNMETDASKLWFTSLTAGAVVGIDKVIMLIALIVFRIGWWATIYCQQILLGMLTIRSDTMGISLLPKWEGVGKVADTLSHGTFLWSNAILRGLLCPFTLWYSALHSGGEPYSHYRKWADDGSIIQNSFFSAGYLMAASIVALKMCEPGPDLAAWMIPEGGYSILYPKTRWRNGTASQDFNPGHD